MARESDDTTDDEPNPDTATCCVDCGRRNDSAVPGETCAECGGTFHNYARIPDSPDALAVALGALDSHLLRNDETGRSYRPRTLVVEDVEANEPVALAPSDLGGRWTARPDPYGPPCDEEDGH